MAIGTAAAIGLGLAGAGSVFGAVSGNRAASKAADVSTQNNLANVGLARDIYGQNKQILSPFVNRGNAAGEQINALLGLGGSPMQQQQVQPNALSQFRAPAGAGYGIADGQAGLGTRYLGGAMLSPDLNYGGTPQAVPNALMPSTTYGANLPSQGGPAPAQGGVGQAGAQNNAFDIFRNSTGYQFRLGEGLDAVNSGYAGAGTLQSGAAMKAINDYAQNMASNEFGNYLGALQSQQAVGAGGASSLAGVGQNFAGTVIGANNANAANQINAQLGRQNLFANALGTVGGGILGYVI